MNPDQSMIRTTRREDLVDAIAVRRSEEFESETDSRRQVDDQLREQELATTAESAAREHEQQRADAAVRAAAEAQAHRTRAEAAAAAAARARAANDAAVEAARRALPERLHEYQEALYAGDLDGAADLLAGVLEPVYERAVAEPATRIDVKALKAEVKRELKVESELESFAQAFPEIVKDPNLAAIADQVLEAELKSGASARDAFDTAGTRTREYVKGVAAQLGMTERAKARAGAAEDSGDVHAVIAEMAALRGRNRVRDE